MKQIIFLTLLLLSVIAIHSQVSITTGIDIKNAISGSNATGNKPALDYTIGFVARDKGLELGVSYENFKAIHYQDYAVSIGTYTGVKNQFYINGEFGQIVRQKNIGTFYYGFNAGYTHWINRLGLSLEANLANRQDIGKWRLSNYFKLSYKILN